MIISIFTGPWLPVPAKKGGAMPKVWQGLAEEFVAQGHQVMILCRSYEGQPQTEFINGVQYIRRGGFSQSTNIYIDLLKDLFYALINFPVLPHAHIIITNDFWLPIFAPLRPKVGKIVVNVNRFPKGQFWLYAKTHLFIAASQVIQKAIATQYPAASSRIRVIHNAIDTSIFSPGSPAKSERKEKVILYVGRIHPEKGIHLLLEAFLMLSQKKSTVKLRIIGPYKQHQGGGGEQYLQTLLAKAEGLNVEFLEPIFDVHKLADAYRDADLFCYPSLAEKGEAFPVAPLEAMATSLVPVVSDLDCFRDLIEEKKTGYYFNHRSSNAAENLADVFYSAILNLQQTQQISVRAVEKASEYSYHKIAKAYLSDFARLIENNKY
jgi:glycosyltransferase involved in cell wall biosynthesis